MFRDDRQISSMGEFAGGKLRLITYRIDLRLNCYSVDGFLRAQKSQIEARRTRAPNTTPTTSEEFNGHVRTAGPAKEASTVFGPRGRPARLASAYKRRRTGLGLREQPWARTQDAPWVGVCCDLLVDRGPTGERPALHHPNRAAPPPPHLRTSRLLTVFFGSRRSSSMPCPPGSRVTPRTRSRWPSTPP